MLVRPDSGEDGLPSRIFQEVSSRYSTWPNFCQASSRVRIISRFPVHCSRFARHRQCGGSHSSSGSMTVFLSSGTWSLMGVRAEEPNLSEEFFIGGFTNEGSVEGKVLLLKNMTGLWILQECVRMWEAAGSITHGSKWSRRRPRPRHSALSLIPQSANFNLLPICVRRCSTTAQRPASRFRKHRERPRVASLRV